jgi:diguanylate cyclase (GGDEF)-like protein
MNILIVDDDFVDRESVKRSLQNIDEKTFITEAESVDRALMFCKSIQFDIVLLDYRTPPRDGVELLLELQKNGLVENNVILMMSNAEDDEIAMRCIEAGAHDFLLKKDISESRLRRAILQASKRFELENELRKSFQQVKKLAERDPLTDLANRYLFEESFKVALANNKRNHSYLSLMVFDIDDFKLINDNFGHLTGDQLLVKLSNRISSCLRGNELFARLGGDEFAIVLTNQDEIHNSNNVAKRIANVLQLPFTIDKREIKVTISVGIAIASNSVTTPEDLLKQADIAMYRSKRRGRGRISFFEDEMQQSVEQRLRMETGLVRALREGEFVMYYQPILYSEDLSLRGFEALIRWQTADGMVPPNEFIPVAEQSHKMIEIGRWIIRETISQLAQWQAQGHTELVVSINISAVQFSDDSLPEYVGKQCREFDVSPQSLEFELTETALIDKPERKHRFIDRLRELGVSIALDDFGTGYSSVSHLKLFPIDTVKLDRLVLPEADKDNRDVLLFTALAQMLNTLGIETVAEGVETAMQEALCKELGITKLQGYYYSRPLIAAEAIKLSDRVWRAADAVQDEPRAGMH